ncbi:PREDICTED: cyclin-dependent kinase inhibitor 3 isoform X4 [Miniopterus natalensis]|uniref:cyclin-dependent kinase inhibitor 3 isoform X4 n=1 Tax=Miniopterus natalensis TaxID=291302 RepID=UPI0007A723E4|nr:PREDICTED: cyclin-dependent kinase inhibitor 3 isoform X4 [Miniopterus natalensis]
MFCLFRLPLSRVNCSQFLGLCALPGCKFKDIRRNIQKDTEELKNYGIQDIFVLCTRGELSKYRVPNLLNLYQQHGITTHHHPIPDGGTPDIASCCEIMEALAICLKNNRKTLIHCYGGVGRSCLGKKYVFIIQYFLTWKLNCFWAICSWYENETKHSISPLRPVRLVKALSLVFPRKLRWEWEVFSALFWRIL